MTHETPKEKREMQLKCAAVSSEALIEKWGADLVRFQSQIDRGLKLSPEDNRRYLFLKAFVVCSLDRREAVAADNGRA